MFFEISQLQHGPLKKVKVKYFWNLLRISKLSLLLIFGEVEAEITDVKDTRGHYQFSHFQITLIDFLSNFSTEFFKINFFSIFSSAHLGSV